MARILITPVKSEYCNFEPFELEGKLKVIDHGDLGKFYMMKNQSFPEKIVTVLEEDKEELAI